MIPEKVYKKANRSYVESIFATPIAYYKFPEDKHNELKEVTRNALSKLSPVTSRWPGAHEKLYHFYQKPAEHFLDDNSEPIIKEFEEFLKSSYKDFVVDIWQKNADPNCFITDCWVNVTKAQGEQCMHTHANSFISGTYYLNTPKGSGNLIFTAPDTSPNKPYIDFDPAVINIFNQTDYSADISEGNLILWPSHLIHQTTPTTGDASRTSISMNFMPKTLTCGAYNYKIEIDQQ